MQGRSTELRQHFFLQEVILAINELTFIAINPHPIIIIIIIIIHHQKVFTCFSELQNTMIHTI